MKRFILRFVNKTFNSTKQQNINLFDYNLLTLDLIKFLVIII